MKLPNYVIGSVLLLMVACGTDGDSLAIPERLADFSDEDAQLFDDWQRSIGKRCSVRSAFPRLYAEIREQGGDVGDDEFDDNLAVDPVALFSATGGSALIRAGDGEFVILGPPETLLLSTFTSHAEHNTTVNGEQRGIALKTQRQGSHCVVTINDEVVYEARLYRSFPVQAHGLPSAVADATEVAGTFVHTVFGDSADGDQSAAAQISSEFTDYAQSAFAPDQRAHGFLHRQLQLDAGVSEQLFPLTPVPEVASVQVHSPHSEQLYFSRRAGEQVIYGPADAVTDLFAGQNPLLTISWLVAPPHLEIANYQDSNTLWPIETQLSLRDVQPDPENPSQWMATAQLATMALAERRTLDDAIGRTCFLNRLRHGLAHNDASEIPLPYAPSSAAVAGPCGPLASDLVGALASADDAARAVAQQATQGPFVAGTYRGWDNLLIQLVQRTAHTEAPLAALFTDVEFSGKAETLAAVDALVRFLRDNPALADAYRDGLVALPFQWLFGDLLRADTGQLTNGLRNLGDGLVATGLFLIQELAGNPQSPTLACADRFDAGRRDAAMELFAVTSGHWSLRPWHDDAGTRLLQDCWDQAIMADYRVAADAALGFAAADEAVGEHSPFYEDDLVELLTHAMDEQWSAAAYEILTDVAAYARVASLLCTADQAVASAVLCASNLRVISAGPDGILNPAAGRRYADLATQLLAIHPRLADDLFFYPEIKSSFLTGDRALWSSCSNQAFQDRTETLFALIDRYQASTDFFERTEIADDIGDHIASECTT